MADSSSGATGVAHLSAVTVKKQQDLESALLTPPPRRTAAQVGPDGVEWSAAHMLHTHDSPAWRMATVHAENGEGRTREARRRSGEEVGGDYGQGMVHAAHMR